METPAEKRIHRVFEASLLLKGAFAGLETASGLALALIGTGTIYHFAILLTQHELLENPANQLANYLRNAAAALSIDTKTFAAIYLLIHGVIKLGLVIELLRGRLWAYPASLVAFGLFIGYQIYRFTFTHSIWLIILTIFDAFILWLIWREWMDLRAERESVGGESGQVHSRRNSCARPAAAALFSGVPLTGIADALALFTVACVTVKRHEVRAGAHRVIGGSAASVAKRKIVVDRKVSPGLSSVVGKFGLFGLSGKCCVSSVNASVWR